MLSSSARIVAIVGVILLLLPVSGDEGTVRVFYYGLGDGFLGQKHAAAWHQDTPEGWPDVVDLVHYGIATSDWSIPFNTEICLEVVAYPQWSEGKYDDLVGTIACGVVVDRFPSWVQRWYGESYDVWPALAEKLIGPDYRRIGTIRARIVQVAASEESRVGNVKR